jgi:hypothetical protein
VAAALFFKGQGGGEELPYLAEYLLCQHFHWSWAELEETPAAVVALWSLYRSVAAQVERAAG